MDIKDMAGHLVRRLHQRSVAVFQARMREAGFEVTPVQFAALDAIRSNPGIDQATIAAQIAYDRATIGGVIDRLEAKGLVARRISETDRRARVVRLTPAGEALLDQLRPVVQGLQSDILGHLSPDETRQFLELARKAAAD